ncbi:MAG TPA: hypothetical protein VJU16_05220, partial [Planctomycetota bacterium]|nr:hypothetical protein [Planctomycetota bacterium]
MKSLAVAALALLIPQSTDSADAAALFRKFEKALVESKGLEVSFSSTIDVKGKKTDRLEGKFRLAKENKAVIEASGTLDEKDFSIKIVSDGNNLKMTVSGKDDLGTI